METLERGTLELDFDPNVLITPLAHVFRSETATSVVHCGVCKARNRILRAHPTYIHYDEESLDLIDDAAQWNVIHPDEKATWLK
jgi:hypothetical protein